MLILFTGVPGSGKSLHAARMMYDCIRWKRVPVIANFEINPETKGYENFHYVPNDKLNPDDLRAFSRSYWGKKRVQENVIMLCIDEAQLLFNTRDWQKSKDRMKWIEFLSQHRHYGYIILMMTQSPRMIDRQIRVLAEYEWQHRKLSSFGFWGKLFKALSLGEIFVCVKCYYGTNQKLGSEFFRGHKKYYELYDSYNTLALVEHSEEKGTQRVTLDEEAHAGGGVL